MDVVNFDKWELRHVQLLASHDADQAERRAMLNGVASVEDAGFDERISGEAEAEFGPMGDDEPEWERLDVQAESIVGGAQEEIERRRTIMGDAYPFILTDGGLVYRASATGVYEFCLAASLNVMKKLPGFPRPTVVFELIARDVIRLYFGRGSEGFRTGWPSDRVESRPRGTLRMFEHLRSLCGEFDWRPRRYLPRAPKPRDLKDAGLDVVVWKPFQDGRGCSAFALGQCACGRTDWETKLGDLCLIRLSNWFDGPTHAHPLRCFCVPFHIPNRAHLIEVTTLAGVTFDRARFALIAEESQDAVNTILENASVNYSELAFLLAAG